MKAMLLLKLRNSFDLLTLVFLKVLQHVNRTFYTLRLLFL